MRVSWPFEWIHTKYDRTHQNVAGESHGDVCSVSTTDATVLFRPALRSCSSQTVSSVPCVPPSCASTSSQTAPPPEVRHFGLQARVLCTHRDTQAASRCLPIVTVGTQCCFGADFPLATVWPRRSSVIHHLHTLLRLFPCRDLNSARRLRNAFCGYNDTRSRRLPSTVDSFLEYSTMVFT